MYIMYNSSFVNWQARDDKAWVEEHYQSTARFNGLIVEADNVLKASVIKEVSNPLTKLFQKKG